MLPQPADLGLLRVVFEELQFSVFCYRICQHAIFHIHKVVEHLDRLEAATHLKLLLVTSQWGCGMPNTIFFTINHVLQATNQSKSSSSSVFPQSQQQ